MAPPRLVILCIACIAFAASAEEELTIAVASNFQATAHEVAREFTRQTQLPVRISAGSTGKLYAQIVNGAPYDVFLAADTERPRRLQQNGLAVPDSYFIYAMGSLVLWSSSAKYNRHDCRIDFERGNYRYLAIANPETAPYGLAAQRYLESVGLWGEVAGKLVFGENVSQALQFVASGNADFGLIAASQVSGELPFVTSCLERIGAADDGVMLNPQAAVILERSRNKAGAQRFVDYLRSTTVAELLQQRGYARVAAADGR